MAERTGKAAAAAGSIGGGAIDVGGCACVGAGGGGCTHITGQVQRHGGRKGTGRRQRGAETAE